MSKPYKGQIRLSPVEVGTATANPLYLAEKIPVIAFYLEQWDGAKWIAVFEISAFAIKEIP